MDRAVELVRHLRGVGIRNTFKELSLDPRAVHTWRWADFHLEKTLLRHDAVFSS